MYAPILLCETAEAPHLFTLETVGRDATHAGVSNVIPQRPESSQAGRRTGTQRQGRALGQAGPDSSRYTGSAPKLCVTGMSSIALMFTWLGSVAAQWTDSATSSAVSAFAPAYSASTRAASPANRTVENSVPPTMPGSTQVTRTPVPCRSARRSRLNCRTKALVAPYTLPPGYGYVPAIEPRLITWPRPRSTMPGSTALVHQARPAQLVSIICCQLSGSARCAGSRPRASPALLTRMSISANAAGKDCTAAATADWSCTSSSTGCTSAPSSSASSSRRSRRRAAMTTRAPSVANLRAMAAPNPALAPVTRTVVMPGTVIQPPG